ncbi:AAEL012815-PA, partial [Aedes aegypti]
VAKRAKEKKKNPRKSSHRRGGHFSSGLWLRENVLENKAGYLCRSRPHCEVVPTGNSSRITGKATSCVDFLWNFEEEGAPHDRRPQTAELKKNVAKKSDDEVKISATAAAEAKNEIAPPHETMKIDEDICPSA